MTYARSRPKLLPRLDSLNLPESGQFENQILLTPGQPAEIAIQVDNPSDQDWQWQITLDGDYPSAWELWNQSAVLELPANSKRSQTIRFQITNEQYFEQEILNRDRRTLKINYESQISIYAQREEQRYLIADQPFQIWVRPACSYLDYLPDIYRKTDFMSRFLSIFEQAFDPSVQTLDTLWAYLDPLTAPKTFLPFLAHWVAWDINPRWTLKQQRRLIRNAIQLHRWRGTRHGLQLYLQLFTELPEENISILESQQTGFVIGQAKFDQSPTIGGGKPFHFSVILRSEQERTLDEALVHEIIQSVKPAFCTYGLQIL